MAAGVGGARGNLGPGVSHGWEQEPDGESARMNDVRSAQGAGWRGRARGKQSCALPGAQPTGDPALGATGASRSPARRSAGTAAWGGAASSAGEPRTKFAALRPAPPRFLGTQLAPLACEHRLRAVSAWPGGGWAAGCASCGARGGRGSSGDVALAAPPRASFFSFHVLGVSRWLSLLPACCSFICKSFSGIC